MMVDIIIAYVRFGDSYSFKNTKYSKINLRRGLLFSSLSILHELWFTTKKRVRESHRHSFQTA